MNIFCVNIPSGIKQQFVKIMPLSVTPLQARLNRDTDLFSKMDPYCVVTVGNETHKTKAHNQGGKNPHWSETLIFNERSDLLRVVIKDKDLIGSDTVGEGVFNISRAYTHPNQVETFPIDIGHKGKSVGQLLIRVVYTF